MYFNPATFAVNTILERLQDEYKAMHFYRNAANWCDITGFKKAAKYYSGEAVSESEHALKLQDFLNAWNVQFNVPSIVGTYTFTSLRNVIEQAYQLEAELYQKYDMNARESMSIDMSVFKLFSDMLNIQFESVAEVRTQLDIADLSTDQLIFEDAAFG